MYNFKSTISYIWPTVMKYKWQFWAIFFFYAARVLISGIYSPLLYKKIIDLISSAGVEKATLAPSLFHYVILIAIALFAGWGAARIGQFMVSKFQASSIRDLHDLSYAKIQEHSYSFFADNFSGALVNKSRKFVRAFELMHDILVDNFWNTFIAFTGMFVVFYLQARVIALIFVVMSVVYIFIIVLMSKKKIEYDLARSAADSKITGYLADTITNVLSIKSSSAIEREIAGFKKVTHGAYVLQLRAWVFGNKQNAIQGFIMIIVQILAAIMTAHLWLTGQISVGMFLLVQSYTIMIGGYFWDLGRAMSRFTEAVSDMEEMVEIFRKTPDILDFPNPEICNIKDGGIEFKNVCFDYDKGTDVFENFSLKIKPGEKIGLVGHSGSGKTTITKLLLRFVDVCSGSILIDGQDIRKMKQDDLRQSISFISQEPVLFHRSIKENIAYSLPTATDEEVIEVAKKAHADEFISELHMGYETLVGERGIKLSGGERQRVAIARAMLKPSPILLLDEATSSLDSISESYIQDAFNKLMEGKTAIVIAHRLSTIQKMDRIVVLDHGKIVEEGTHKQLLRKKGFYADLWNHQTGGFLD